MTPRELWMAGRGRRAVALVSRATEVAVSDTATAPAMYRSAPRRPVPQLQ